MSRAFTKETDRDEDVVPPPPDLPAGTPNRITPEGAARLRAELATLRAARAAVRGADGAEARATFARAGARIAYLEARIATFVETAPPSHPDRVGFGTTVVLTDAEGRERRWQIVGVDEAAPADGKLSWVSPLGKAILGARAGDSVRLVTPSGEDDVEVVEVVGHRR